MKNRREEGDGRGIEEFHRLGRLAVAEVPLNFPVLALTLRVPMKEGKLAKLKKKTKSVLRWNN